MKKFYAFAAAAVAALSMNAQNGAPLYATGAAPAFDPQWEPSEPAEFVWDGTNYTLELDGLTQFKISTAKDADATENWASFNAACLCAAYTEADLGKPVALAASDGNIGTPWQGKYVVTVAGDLSTITMTTDTPKPTGYIKLFARGDMNNWGNDDESLFKWEFETSDGITYWLDLTGDMVINASDSFKLADKNWDKYNYSAGEELFPGEADALFTYNNMVNTSMGDTYTNATIKVVVNPDLTTDPALVTFYETIVEHQSAIESVEIDANAPVEYYTIQGVKVAGELNAGIYIAKQGDKVSKILVK